MNIAILAGHRDTDVWTIPLSYAGEFKRRGFGVKMYSTLNLKAENISLLDSRAWNEQGIHQILKDIKTEKFIPDIILHCDFGLFKSNLINKNQYPNAKWIYESGDDPQCFGYNLQKVQIGNFDLILSPDIRAVDIYCKQKYNAVWCPHFADQELLQNITQEPIYDSITSRHKSEDFFVELKKILGDRFEARNDFLEGKDHLKHLMKGKIVVQNSKYKEITRRIFEGMICNRLIITDRIDTNTGIDQIFKENEDIVYFDNINDCAEKINYYIQNETKRLEIANNGYNKVIKNHTVSKRVEKLLKLI